MQGAARIDALAAMDFGNMTTAKVDVRSRLLAIARQGLDRPGSLTEDEEDASVMR